MANIISQMPGKIVEVTIKVGDKVTKGQQVCMIEAMKMQMPIMSTYEGVVKDIKIQVGQGVKKGDILMEIDNA